MRTEEWVNYSDYAHEMPAADSETGVTLTALGFGYNNDSMMGSRELF